VDLDHDGVAELVVGSEAGGTPAVFRRQVLDSSAARGLPSLPSYSAPLFADVWGVGTKDCFAGNEGGGVLYYRSQGPRPRPSK